MKTNLRRHATAEVEPATEQQANEALAEVIRMYSGFAWYHSAESVFEQGLQSWVVKLYYKGQLPSRRVRKMIMSVRVRTFLPPR